MAAEREQNLENFKKEGHSAFVIGYTGEIGKVLVKELDEVKAFKRVVLVGRRQTNITQKLGAGFVRHFDKILHSTFWEYLALKVIVVWNTSLVCLLVLLTI